MDEEALVEAVIRVRAAGLKVESAAQVHAALTSSDEQYKGLTLQQVKKACSKAAKRTGGGPAPPTAAPAVPQQTSQAKAKKEAKAAKLKEAADAAELKAAESAMMDTQRRLRAAKAGGDQMSAQVDITGTVESFVNQITTRAIAGLLEPGDEEVLKERIDADIAALTWVKLATKSGALSLTEDVAAVGVEVQLARLEQVRGAKDHAAARACFVEGPRSDSQPYQGVDRAVARQGAGGLVEDLPMD
jgi:hypothetical protein